MTVVETIDKLFGQFLTATDRHHPICLRNHNELIFNGLKLNLSVCFEKRLRN